jgi:hypothetical protein
VDGRWFCIYKAVDRTPHWRPSLAVSADGINWEKIGLLNIDGIPKSVFLSGSIFSSSVGPLFIGLEKDKEGYSIETERGHGVGRPPSFVVQYLDLEKKNLHTIFRTVWKSLSQYEYSEHPLLGYCSIVFDPVRTRYLCYVQAIDGQLGRQKGVNETVERLLLYETPL